MFYFVFFFKQKTAYEMRISDWGSDVCSSDLFLCILRLLLLLLNRVSVLLLQVTRCRNATLGPHTPCIVHMYMHIASNARTKSASQEIGRASCRERVCQYV